MGHRSTALIFSALLAMASSGAMALGLGKIKLDSALNQPLRAEIELLEVRDLTEPEILVGLAKQEDFARIGVDKTYFLSDLRFQVVLDKKDGGPKIILTSRKPVREPYLNFVIEAQWPSGKLLREYTLLLDLPVYADTPAAPVQPSTTAPVRQTTTTTTTTQTTDSAYNPRSSYNAPGATSSRPSASTRETTQEPLQPSYTGDSYTVVANDTLWEIAARVRPDRGVSIQQTMLAIQRNNPEAFINDNINLLKKGQILRIPDSNEISAAYSARNAIAEVASQNQQWSSSYTPEAGSEYTSGRSYDDDSSATETREGRVKLSSPDDMYSSSEGRGSGGSADASTEALENELAITMEQLDKSSRENDELRSKVEALEEQITTMEKMISVSSEKMREMELSAAKRAQEEEERQAQSTPETQIEDLYRDQAEGSLEGDESTAEDTYGDSALAEATVTPSATPVATPEVSTPTPTATPVQRNKVVAPAPAPQKTIVDHIMDNILYIGIGLLVIIGGAVFALRRRSSEDEEFDDFLNQSGGEEVAADGEEPEPLFNDADSGDNIDLGQYDETPDQFSADDELEEPVEAPADDEQEMEAQTEDVVAEADIYIAYGKYDQVEEMLNKALARDPNDENVRLKLLEVLSLQHDVEKFDEQYAKLLETASPDVAARAEKFRESIPNAPAFAGAAVGAGLAADDDFGNTFASSGDDDASSDMSLDLDLGDLDSDGAPNDGMDLDLPDFDDDKTVIKGSSDTEELDLDLDFGDSSDTDSVADIDEDDLALDLDLDDGSSETAEDSLDLDLDFDASPMSDEDSLGLDLDLGDELDSDASDELSSDLGGDDDLDLGEFNLDLEEENTGGDAEVGKSSLNLSDDYSDEEDSLDLDTELDADLGGDDDEISLDGLDDLSLDTDDDLGLDTGLDTDDSSDSLDMGDDDLDLSSLDKELDALTSDMDDLDGDIDLDLASPSPSVGEPETDFDDLDAELDLDMADADQGSDVADELEADFSLDEVEEDEPAAVSSESDFELPNVDPDAADDDSDLDFLSDSDETGTKLDLARAYIDMGDQEGARDIIKEIIAEGNDQQKEEAQALLARIEA